MRGTVPPLHKYEGVSKSRTESITKYTLTTINTRWEPTQRVMAAKLTGLIQLNLVAESCTICSSRSRRPVRKLLNTPSCLYSWLHVPTNPMEQNPSWEVTVAKPVKKLPAFYGTRRSITVFTIAHHWSLSWAIWLQSTTPRPISLWAMEILSYHLRLGILSGLFLSGFPTEILYVFLISAMRAAWWTCWKFCKARMRGAIHPLPQYVFIAWCLVKYRDNFNFTLTDVTIYSVPWLLLYIELIPETSFVSVDSVQHNIRIMRQLLPHMWRSGCPCAFLGIIAKYLYIIR
jgi:hypothetical protein